METRGRTLFVLLFLFAFLWGQAQDEAKEDHKPQVRGAIMMANSHVPQATASGDEVAIIPTWGFDLDYFFHKRWSVGLQADVKLQTFEVEDNHVIIERSNPVILAAVIHYHALRHWSFYLGPGYEFDSHHNFWLGKAGTEYSFEVTEDFEIALNLIYENKEEVYTAWTLGIAFNKRLWRKGSDK